MPITTAPALESIDLSLLATVSGGCHKKCSSQQSQNTIIQMPAMPAPQIVPQMIPEAAPADSGPSVSTNVSINGQPTASA